MFSETNVVLGFGDLNISTLTCFSAIVQQEQYAVQLPRNEESRSNREGIESSLRVMFVASGCRFMELFLDLLGNAHFLFFPIQF